MKDNPASEVVVAHLVTLGNRNHTGYPERAKVTKTTDAGVIKKKQIKVHFNLTVTRLIIMLFSIQHSHVMAPKLIILLYVYSK